MNASREKSLAKKSTQQTQSVVSSQLELRIREGVLILSIAVAVFLLVSFASYHSTDPGWSSTGANQPVLNLAGRVGAWFADVFLYAFGYPAYIFPFMLVYAAWVGCFRRAEHFHALLFSLRLLGFVCVLLTLSALFELHMPDYHQALPLSSGGVLGQLIGDGFVSVFNLVGTTLILLAVFIVGLTLFTGMSWLKLLEWIGRGVVYAGQITIRGLMSLVSRIREYTSALKDERRLASVEIAPKEPMIKCEPKPAKKEPLFKKAAKAEKSVIEKPVYQPSSERSPVIAEKAKRQAVSFSRKTETKGLPSIDLLDEAKVDDNAGYSKETLQQMSKDVETHLHDFGVSVKVVAIQPGPVITRFELSLAAGVKVSRISGLAKDLARALSVNSVRIVEVIAGKSVIGLEVPNEHRETVSLREVLESSQYQSSTSPLSLTLGKDIGGHPVVVDLAKMPHLLVAGTTGSGKSVALNAMILSMLYKATPEQARFVFIDPKMLELSIYDGIPHLLTPVVTNMKEAANALRWCVSEMDRRYQLMANLGVRNLQGYNVKVADAINKKKPLTDPFIKPAAGDPPVYLEKLPSIVVVIDEFADMMMIVGKKVEELITRIAQKARAAGIHLILATQRPSVDVITGVIKANIPTRVAFQVSSRIDSRTILDQQGAEQLLGYGDMLYLPAGTGVPARVHGAFVGDNEVHRVVADWRERAEPQYIEEITEDRNDDGSVTVEGDDADLQDPLYDQAVNLVLESQRPSISYVQRRLKIGYNRSARLLDAMEREGVVSPMDQSGSRELLVTSNRGGDK